MRIVNGTAALATSALAMVACAQAAPTSPETVGSRALHPGTEVAMFGSAITVSLVRVPSDSRCPQDVVCVWAGNAEVVLGIRLGKAMPTEHTVNTSLQPRSVDVAGYRVHLDSLTPYPRAGSETPPARHQAWVTVTRTGSP